MKQMVKLIDQAARHLTWNELLFSLSNAFYISKNQFKFLALLAGYGSSAAASLVLFILLVIITSAFVW
ncbi:YjcZ family sporulation protein [Paenibacillus anseongense]|uniref:YjcZ family sporulation protein n=1 Tax=Paenibacillus anseongense TaxID=2682845 RepID=UPI002DBF7345|nr:YjcZ family sporulation protein [Paenibacillus anseongense]MEC0270764.1 YjcZ family sporulation protein [Paenibacillus anseongense]